MSLAVVAAVIASVALAAVPSHHSVKRSAGVGVASSSQPAPFCVWRSNCSGGAPVLPLNKTNRQMPGLCPYHVPQCPSNIMTYGTTPIPTGDPASPTCDFSGLCNNPGGYCSVLTTGCLVSFAQTAASLTGVRAQQTRYLSGSCTGPDPGFNMYCNPTVAFRNCTASSAPWQGNNGVNPLPSTPCTLQGWFEPTCPAVGMYAANSIGCLQCVAGTWNDGVDALTACHACPPKATSGPGATACRPCGAGECSCPAGQFSPLAGVPCAACPAGSACPLSSAAPQPCPLGTSAPAAGAAQCSACPAGAYCPSPAVQPSLCPAGTYQPAENQTAAAACLRCPAGTYSVTVGAVSMVRNGCSSPVAGDSG